MDASVKSHDSVVSSVTAMVAALTARAPLASTFPHSRPFRVRAHHRPRVMQPVTGTSADDARTKTQEKASEKTSTAGTPGPTLETHAPPTPHAVRPEPSKVPVTDDERAVASAAERKALQRARIASAPGFVAALDQSGGSTPRALALYGITDVREKDKARMFGVMHDMRSRIITCDAFDGEKIIGAILFEDTVFERQVLGLPTATYLWDVKNVVPFIKIDKGLEQETDGVQLMRPIPDLAHTLAKCGCFHEPYDPHDPNGNNDPRVLPASVDAFHEHYREVVDPDATDDDVKSFLDRLAGRAEPYLLDDDALPAGVDHGVVRSALAAHHRLKVEREAREAKTKARQKAFLLGPRDPGAVTALANAKLPGDCVFGTKARSVIRRADERGIKRLVAQQFAVAAQVLAAGLTPIIEPEVAIDAPEKAKCERLLRDELSFYLDTLADTQPDARVCLKVTLPEDPALYDAFVLGRHRSVMRVFALSGGYDRNEACERLSRCVGMSASFSRAFTEGLNVDQAPATFRAALEKNASAVYDAATT